MRIPPLNAKCLTHRAGLRRWWSRCVRRNRYEHCRACGRSVGLVWAAENSLWNFVIGGPDHRDDPGGSRCIPCFNGELERLGFYVMWSPGPLDRFPQPFLAHELLERERRAA